MFKDFGAIRVLLNEDTPAGLRVRPLQTPHTGDIPVVYHTGLTSSDPWIGITVEAGKEGDIVPVAPPYSGLTMVLIDADTTEKRVHTGCWVFTKTGDGYFTCNYGTGQIPTGIIVTPELDEDTGAGKIVKAMIFTGRWIYDVND